MAWDADKKQFVASLVLLLDPLHGLLKKWSHHMPPGWDALPLLINFLIAAAAVFVMYRYASSHKKFSVWLVPVVVTALALGNYLRW